MARRQPAVLQEEICEVSPRLMNLSWAHQRVPWPSVDMAQTAAGQELRGRRGTRHSRRFGAPRVWRKIEGRSDLILLPKQVWRQPSTGVVNLNR